MCCFSVLSFAGENEFLASKESRLKSFDYFSLCYHDVRDDVKGDLDEDSGALNTEHLAQHFEWLKVNGYHPISIDDIENARKGLKPLPKKAVLLSFDDGYKSFYTHIYPLLKLYNYPAVFALVTDWLMVSEGQSVEYGKDLKPRSNFLTWNEVREMQASGLVEIASHTHALHKGIFANPQKNTQAAVVTRQFINNRYETDKEYSKRILNDLKTSTNIIKKKTGKSPRAIVWPYGRYNEEVWQLAQKAGFTFSLILGDGKNKLNNGEHIGRHLIDSNPDIGQFKAIFEKPTYNSVLRAAHVDIDYIYDPDPEVTERNLGKLVERIYQMGVNAVFLQAFADPDGDGNADALYFKNRHLPVRADLFNRVAWQLETRANVSVYAWMPVLAFDFGDEIYKELGVKHWNNGSVQPSPNNYKRLSPFNDKAKQLIKEIYADLGRYSSFNGVLFHDDAYLNDFEDISPEAMKYYQSHGLDARSIDTLRRNSKSIKAWATVKEKAINDFTLELVSVLKNYQAHLKTARNIYAMPILNEDSHEWYAQSLPAFTKIYDYTAIMAMPYMENAKDPDSWLKQLRSEIHKKDLPNNKIVFELQAVDWRNSKPIPTEVLARQMLDVVLGGFVNIAYYPDNVHLNHPRLEGVRESISLDDFPYRRK